MTFSPAALPQLFKNGEFPSKKELPVKCGECGMPTYGDEYHPYAACLMFKQCGNSEIVRANLIAVYEFGRKSK